MSIPAGAAIAKAASARSYSSRRRSRGGCTNLAAADLWLARRLVGGTLRFPQGLDPFLAVEQAGRAGRPDRTAGEYRQRESGCRRVTRCLDRCEHVVLAERLTAHHDLAAHGLESRPDGLEPVF